MASEAPPQPAGPPPEAAALETGADAVQKPPVVKRSWRRKYRKMRIQFENAMMESNSLIAREWKAMGTARRLQENNDQLLDALLDFNQQLRVNARLRYDLRQLSATTAAATADAAGPPLEAGPDAESIQLRLQELRADLASGTITADEYAQKTDHLHKSQAAQQALKSITSLEAKVPYTTHADLPDKPIEGIDLSELAPGYMTPSHEEEYLLALDQVLGEPGFDPALQHGRPIRLACAPPPLSEKDLTVRNPDSVYNWLRKHQPQVFLQDKDPAHHENLSEKSAPKSSNAAGKKGKRESAVGGSTPGPRDHEEDDYAAPETGKARRKTVGDPDDTAYRPKGGSSRPAKRKREEGDTPSGKNARKKNRASTGVGAQ